ncbi:MAG: DUF3943 domain-containing protein [Candidatus Rokuibacteriota bacterium]|nr:MAG: DUF3943 domain-containing protein [Candidatus Rokubacteria bacterium]
MPSRAGGFRKVLLTGAIALALATPRAGFAEEPAASPVLSWETGEGKSYFIPALEVPAFILGLHLFNRFLTDSNDYNTDGHSIRKNLTGPTVIDKDPFSVNQIGHPYQGSIYYGLARSAGLNYWQSLAYSLAGSYLWETFGETTPPSLNDHIASGIGGSFVGEALKEQEGFADYAMTYGLPGKPGYRYSRPFDYFHFEFTAVPNASTVSNAIENVSIRGLLAGAKYEVGDNYRGVAGLFGIFDYLSPQIFRVSTTALSLGTIGQWWLSPAVALQGTALGGVGFGAAGTVADKEERDYHYGVAPQVILGLRLIFGDRAMLDGTGRLYYVAGTGSGGASGFGAEIINRWIVGFTVRVFGPHAIGIQYLVSTRDAGVPGQRDRHQQVQTVSLAYNFLGHTRFGAVEWRTE